MSQEKKARAISPSKSPFKHMPGESIKIARFGNPWAWKNPGHFYWRSLVCPLSEELSKKMNHLSLPYNSRVLWHGFMWGTEAAKGYMYADTSHHALLPE
jgi:hypothetical protein